MTPQEILIELNKTSPYRPNDICHYCGAVKPAHLANCIWLEIEIYDDTAVRLAELQQLAFLMLNGAKTTQDQFGMKVHIDRDIRVTPALRRLALRLGIKVEPA